jgi:hypothetical protein
MLKEQFGSNLLDQFVKIATLPQLLARCLDCNGGKLALAIFSSLLREMTAMEKLDVA